MVVIPVLLELNLESLQPVRQLYPKYSGKCNLTDDWRSLAEGFFWKIINTALYPGEKQKRSDLIFNLFIYTNSRPYIHDFEFSP